MIAFLNFLFPGVSESHEKSSSQCIPSSFQLQSGTKELSVTLLLPVLFTGFWTFHPVSSLTLMRLFFWQCVTAALLTPVLFWWDACVIEGFFFMLFLLGFFVSAVKAKDTKYCRYSRPSPLYKTLVFGDNTGEKITSSLKVLQLLLVLTCSYVGKWNNPKVA